MSLLGLIKERKDAQWYLPVEGGEFTATAEDLKSGMVAKLKERSSAFGTSLFLDLVEKDGNRTSFKVSGQVAEKIRDAKAVETAVVDMGSIVVTKLAITKAAKATEKGKDMADVIYRATFNWE